MESLKGKRLLILGGIGLMCSIVETAKSMGVYTIVADYLADSPAKQLADKSCNVSTRDINALVELCRKEQVDGVLTGFSEGNLYAARELCDRLDLPFYATKEQLDITANKLQFKQMCEKYGVPTVKQFELDDRFLPEHLEKLEYPLYIKPADSGGSKGCGVCREEKDIREAVEYALSFSPSKQIIVERYMDPDKVDDLEVYLSMANGEIFAETLFDRAVYRDEKNASSFTAALKGPSKHTKEYYETLDEKVKKMCSEVGMKNGTVSFQMFHDETGFHLYEVAYRLNGGENHFAAKAESGYDMREMMIYHALTGKIPDDAGIENVTLYYKNVYYYLIAACSNGVISRIEGLEELQADPHVLHVSMLAKVGDKIESVGNRSQILSQIIFTGNTWEELMPVIQNLGTKLVAYDENDEPMMLPPVLNF